MEPWLNDCCVAVEMYRAVNGMARNRPLDRVNLNGSNSLMLTVKFQSFEVLLCNRAGWRF